MHVRGVGTTHVGKVREHNEDYFIVDNELQVYIVCDGMGGHSAGEVASEMAAQVTLAKLNEHTQFFQTFTNSKKDCAKLTEIVKSSVLNACTEVYNSANQNPGQKGMGTTLTMLMVLGKRGILAHVGDSRLYLHRQEKLYKLSVDHTLLNDLLAQGVPKKELEETGMSLSNILTRAIGKEPSVKVDLLLFDVLPDDTFLLCSDGLDSVDNPKELGELLSQKSLDQIPQVLVDLANKRDGADNITAVTVRWESAATQTSEDELWSTEIQLRFDILKKIYLFKHVTFRELSKLLTVMQIVSCDAGETIITEGSQSNHMYILLEGQLKVSRGNTEIQTLKPGDHVGEMALLNNQPRSATVSATEITRMLMVERDTLFALLREEAAIGVKILWNLARGLSSRLNQANQQAFGPISIRMDEEQLRSTPIPPQS